MAITNINGVPFYWNEEEDKNLFGKLFPNGAGFPNKKNQNANLNNTQSTSRFGNTSKTILDNNPFGSTSKFFFHGYNAFSDDGYLSFDYPKLLHDIREHSNGGNNKLIFDARNNYVLENIFNTLYKIDGEDIEINGFLSERVGPIIFTNNHIEVNVEVPQSGISKSSNIFYYFKFLFSDLSGTNNAQKYAITLYSNNYEHYEKILKHISWELTDSGKLTIANKIQDAMDNAKINTDYFALNWLYENAPQFVFEIRNDKILYEDLLLLLKYEQKKVFNHGSGIIKNLTGFKDLSFVYNQFIGFPDLVIQIYSQLNKENKVAFCKIINTLSILFNEKNIISQKFYVGDRYQFLSHPKASVYNSQNQPLSPTSKVYLLNDVDIVHVGSGGAVSASSGMAAEYNYQQAQIAKNKISQSKFEFHPLELVELYYEDVPKNVIIPAIYAKYIADEKETEEAWNSFFLALDIISILIAGGLLIRGAKGLARLFAMADILTATIDIFIRSLSEKDKLELSKTPEGKWFLENWDSINAVIGIGMLTTALAQGLIKNGPKIIEWFERNKMANLADEFRKLYYKAEEIVKDINKLGDELDAARLTVTQKQLLPGITKRYYNSFRTILDKLAKEADIIKEWNKLKPMKDLDKETIKMMKEWRDFYFAEEAYNVAIMKQRIKVKDKIIELEYKAFAGDGKKAEGFCKNPDLDYIAKQLKMPISQLKKQFVTLKDNMGRFYDSEHKIFAQNDIDLRVLYAKYGESNVHIVEQNIKTLFEPCLSCKKQIVIRQQLYDIKYISVEATRLDKLEYVKNNKQFLEIFK